VCIFGRALGGVLTYCIGLFGFHALQLFVDGFGTRYDPNDLMEALMKARLFESKSL
jgi:membrane protein YqaA with SNARE-associated domain